MLVSSLEQPTRHTTSHPFRTSSPAVCLNKVRIIFDAEIDEIEYPAKPEDTKRPINIKLKQPQSGIKKVNSVVKSHILLTATGREANTKALNLKEIGVDTDKSGNVRVDGSLRTSVERIYAAGEGHAFSMPACEARKGSIG